MRNYLNLLEEIITKGNDKSDRTGTGTLSLFGRQLHFDLNEGFPLLTTKKVWFKGVVHELLWMLSGDTNIKALQKENVHIWDEWADHNGNLGPVYGYQWRKWNSLPAHSSNLVPIHIDQISDVIDQIRKNPDSRRHIVTAWNPSMISSMALPPCHCFFQFYVFDKKLSCQLYQRSADYFLGSPFNIASYALLTHMIAHVTGLGVGEFVYTLGDVHLYKNHIDQAKLQLSRSPMSLPDVVINKKTNNIFEIKYEDIELIGYKSHPAIKAEVSV